MIINDTTYHDKEKESPSIPSTSFNISNTIIGSGILGFSYILKEVGLVNGLIFILCGALLGITSLFYLQESFALKIEKCDDGKFDYEDIAYFCFKDYKYKFINLGWIMSFLVKLSVFGITYGASISYLIAIKDFLSKFAIYNSKFENQWLIMFIVTTILFVVCLFTRTMDNMKYISYISLSLVGLFIIFVTYTFSIHVSKFPVENVSYFNYNLSMLRVLGSIVFAFECQASYCAMAKDYKKEDLYKTKYSIFIGIFMCFAIYLWIAVFGYIMFTTSVERNIILNFNFRSLDTSFFIAIYTVSLCLTYPCCVLPCRISLDNFINLFWETENKDLKDLRYIILTFLICYSTYFFSVFFPSIGIVFDLTGSTASSASTFIFPTLFYVKLTDKKWYHWSVILAICLFLFGILFGIFGTTLFFLTEFKLI